MENQSAPQAMPGAHSHRRRRRRVLSSGIIPIYRSRSDGSADIRLLLLRAYNYWDFPKGVVCQGEDPLQAAIRELGEETTISTVSFPWGREFRETPPYARGKVARYYIGLVETLNVALLPNPVHGEIEHHEYRWVSADEARRLVSERVRPILEWALESIRIST